jgi:hypothetical protein
MPYTRPKHEHELYSDTQHAIDYQLTTMAPYIEYKSNPKRSCCDEHKTIPAIIIQRRYTYGMAVRTRRLGITSAMAKKFSAEELRRKIEDTETINVMKTMLYRVCVLTAEGRSQTPADMVSLPSCKHIFVIPRNLPVISPQC